MYLKLNWHCFKYICSIAGNSSFVTPLPLYCENLSSLENSTQQAKPKSEQPVLSDDASNLDSVWTTLLMIDDYIHAFFKLQFGFSVMYFRFSWLGICLGHLLFWSPFQLATYQIIQTFILFCYYNAVNSIEISRWGRKFGISYAFSIFIWTCLLKGEFNPWELLKLISRVPAFG